MGQITDTLRATLRELAHSDARLYRGLEQELRDVAAEPAAPAPRIKAAAEPRASRADLEGLSVKALWALCKERGIKRLSNGPKAQQVEALLSHPDGPPLFSALPTKTTRAKPSGADHQLLEQRLDRLEQLLLLIAKQVGVPKQALTSLLSRPL